MGTIITFPRSATVKQQQEVSDLKEALFNTLHRLIWRYGCVHCNLKGNKLLCAECFGRTRRDVRKIQAYLAKAAL